MILCDSAVAITEPLLQLLLFPSLILFPSLVFQYFYIFFVLSKKKETKNVSAKNKSCANVKMNHRTAKQCEGKMNYRFNILEYSDELMIFVWCMLLLCLFLFIYEYSYL